jgi:hypothetical protein
MTLWPVQGERFSEPGEVYSKITAESRNFFGDWQCRAHVCWGTANGPGTEARRRNALVENSFEIESVRVGTARAVYSTTQAQWDEACNCPRLRRSHILRCAKGGNAAAGARSEHRRQAEWAASTAPWAGEMCSCIAGDTAEG